MTLELTINNDGVHLNSLSEFKIKNDTHKGLIMREIILLANV